MSRRKNYHDVNYIVWSKPNLKTKKRKRVVIAHSTEATRLFLEIVCDEHPNITENELFELLKDRRRYIQNPEAIQVVRAHIDKGYGNFIADYKPEQIEFLEEYNKFGNRKYRSILREYREKESV